MILEARRYAARRERPPPAASGELDAPPDTALPFGIDLKRRIHVSGPALDHSALRETFTTGFK